MEYLVRLWTFVAIVASPAFSGTISTHVLDIGNGFPGGNVQVNAQIQQADGAFYTIGDTVTDMNGRVPNVAPNMAVGVGVYKLHFNLADYFNHLNQTTFYPFAEVVFKVEDATSPYHVPLLLSRFGYTTYKGQ